ncbi:MAG TPA: CHASE sensor domain-containing protein, partial [Candidatus Aminicenantes bacterium]|nr:CHASE sensor domain-containing protein [Candidatus Aminicenantes bacterium]
MAIVMLSVGIALFSVGIVFFTVQLISTRRVTSARLDSTARIIGTHSAGALSFNDRAIAEQTLEALAAEPDVQAAQLFDRDGKPFARYVRSGATSPLPADPGPDGVRLEASQLVLFRPIILDNERIGTIFLRSGLEGQNSLLRLFASLALGVTGLALILALGISNRLQRVVSEPILHLTNLTRQVSERKDYSLRADIRNQDELGQLAGGLNEMLARIQTHEADLRKLNRRLRLQSGCNQTIVRSHDENSLLAEMCQFLLDVGGYPLVWIDYCDPTGAEEPHRMAQAWRGGNPPRQEADYPSSVAIPLGSLDQPLGVLSVCADQPGAFDAEEVRLLTELASDLVYGIVTLQAREQRTKAENELKNTQLFLANVIESMPSMLIAVRPDGSITQWNEAATRATGIPASRALGQNLWTLLPPFAKFRTHVTRMIETRRIMEFYKEVMQLEAEKKFFNVSLFPLVTTQFTGVVLRADDVTEIERKEHQLRQSQKMETVGTLAGGLAHDFNNVLGGIIGTLSLLQFKQNSPGGVPQDELRKSITLIETAANRAAEMVQHLLALSRKQELTFVPVDLNLTIGHVMDICRNTLDKSVELAPHPASTPAMINSDPTQMEQVLL